MTAEETGLNRNAVQWIVLDCNSLAIILTTFMCGRSVCGSWGSVVVKALRYYSDGPRTDSRWCLWGFFSVAPTDRTMCPGVDSASENEYQRFLLG